MQEFGKVLINVIVAHSPSPVEQFLPLCEVCWSTKSRVLHDPHNCSCIWMDMAVVNSFDSRMGIYPMYTTSPVSSVGRASDF